MIAATAIPITMLMKVIIVLFPPQNGTSAILSAS